MDSKVKWTRNNELHKHSTVINRRAYGIRQVLECGCDVWRVWVDGKVLVNSDSHLLRDAKAYAEQHAAEAEQPEAASDIETPAEASTHEATRQAEAQESDTTIKRDYIGEMVAESEKYPEPESYAVRSPEWNLSELPFADPAALDDSEGAPTSEAQELGVSEELFDACMEVDIQAIQDMIDDASKAADRVLPDLVAERETVAEQQATIEELRQTIGNEHDRWFAKDKQMYAENQQLRQRVAELEADVNSLACQLKNTYAELEEKS